MFELDFEIDEILKELEGKTIEDKLEELDDIAADLQSALDEIYDAQDQIAKQHKAGIEEEIIADINSFIESNSLQDYGTFSNKSFVFDYDNQQVEIYFYDVENEKWLVSLHLLTHIVRNDLRNQFLNNLASIIGADYKEGNYYIEAKVDADEVAWTMCDWIQKIVNSSLASS